MAGHPRVGATPGRREGAQLLVPHNVRVRAKRGGGNTFRAALLSAGVTGTVVAWGLLVFAAIDFGGKARDGEPGNWWFLGLATLGAMACMFLAILLASRLQAEMRGQGPSTRPRRTTSGGGKHGGKRAAR